MSDKDLEKNLKNIFELAALDYDDDDQLKEN
jgi:hypothetical protein